VRFIRCSFNSSGGHTDKRGGSGGSGDAGRAGADRVVGGVCGGGEQLAKVRQQRLNLARVEDGRFDQQRGSPDGRQPRVGLERVLEIGCGVTVRLRSGARTPVRPAFGLGLRVRRVLRVRLRTEPVDDQGAEPNN